MYSKGHIDNLVKDAATVWNPISVYIIIKGFR